MFFTMRVGGSEKRTHMCGINEKSEQRVKNSKKKKKKGVEGAV